ncbi:type IV fimbrial biogenesis protein FimT [Collimonas sp. OK242]|uniref:GspH/FimT family pseudopilin n=1 Tax=Collimonas sp. OK242 TaxID=1798195 RepID=UPI000897D3EA|nr:GspH/FimT family pseudopilin [Collimonas sp. OK242]SDX07035.1 type IV fimbrial biogenesis protein FimT [Collimonas sp. OK242]
MRVMQASPEERGFSLVELMITIALAAILMAVAIPSFSSWIRNTKIRSTAEALQNGIRLAKTEAVRRSRLVDFRLTAVKPEKDAARSRSGTNWYVQQNAALLASDSSDADYNLFVQGSSLSGANANVTVAGSVDTVTFDSLGRVVSISGNSPPYTFDINTADAGYRKLRVVVTASGQIRMCDPQITLSSTTPTGC